MSPRRTPSILVAVVLALLCPSNDAAADGPYYTVQSGDALSLLAERFEVSVEQIRAWNELEGDRILVGQRLRVTDEGEPAEAAEAPDDAAEPATERAAEAHPEADEPPAEPRAPRAPARDPGPTYAVRAGDTLSHIARRFGMTLEELRARNDLTGTGVRVGQVLRVAGGAYRHEVELRPGDSLGRVAAQYEVRPRDILTWNPRLRPERLQAGATVVVWSDVPPSRSESVGLPHRGALLHAERLPSHPGYVVRDTRRAFGTVETVRWIVEGFDAVTRAFPRAPRVRVHDLSDRDGGFLAGHRSHQSGRDVDISYYQRRCGGEGCYFRHLAPDDLDAERQWALLKAWLEKGRLEAVFVDYSLQRPLYEQARREGATRAQLSHWFQYPHGPDYPLGIVRHFPNHRDHLHARFVCPDTDHECR